MAGMADKEMSQGKRKYVDQLATHLPDQVIDADHHKSLPYQVTLQGVLLFLDISGFTSLTEKYSMNAKNGTDQLTKTLNGYMQALVNEILINDGDVLKFAGDAILSLWEVTSFLKMKATVGHCMKTAKGIQDRVGEYMTSAGVKLRVKVGIAAGEVMVTYLGNPEYCHNVTMGRAVSSVNAAEGFCVPGDIVISPSAWCHCAGIPAEVELCEDGKHVKLLSMGNYVVDYEYRRTEQITMAEATDFGISNLPVLRKSRKASVGDNDDLIEIVKKPVEEESDTSRVRKSILKHNDEHTNARLRLYVATPVLRKLDDGQPLEYLSEMRQVTILFINLVLEDCTKYEATVTLQKTFNVIYGEIKSSAGCMNKVFMFDKGCTFLAIFGLPGFKHENDCARALQCSYKIATECAKIPKVVKTSIGVTTGSSFCGVMGHTHRHEYTVIGRKVNMAARLMMHYPGKVTCDNETFHHAKLNKANFTQLELKVMKGLQNVGTIREFKENKSRKGTMEALYQQEIEFPIVGRVAETEAFMKEIRAIKRDPKKGSSLQAIVVQGDSGIGKSRFLDSLVVKAMGEGIKVVMLVLHTSDAKSPYYAVKNLIIDLLDLEMEASHHEREHYLFSILQDEFVVENLALLNDLLHLKLPLHEQFLHMSETQRKKALHDILFRIVHEVASDMGFVIFCVDDAQYMDRESWEFIADLGQDLHSLVLLSLKTSSSHYMRDVAAAVIQQPTTMFINLTAMQPQNIGALACQLLAVCKIPQRLEEILRQRSHGLPSWCEQLLYSMLYDGLLNIQKFNPKEEDPEPMVAPAERYKVQKVTQPPNKLQSQTGGKRKMSLTAESATVSGRALSGSEALVCYFSESFVITDVRLPDSIKGMIQARIDRMEEIDQMLVKTSAVVGLKYPRKMLDALLDKRMTEEKVNESLERLAENGIFECGAENREHMHQVSGIDLARRRSIVEKKFVYTCNCLGQGPIETHVGNCMMLSFQTATIQETAYEMYTENLRRTLHVKAAKFMESEVHKCSSCGGADFLVSKQVEDTIEKVVEPVQVKSTKDTGSDMAKGHFKIRRLSYRRPSVGVERYESTATGSGESLTCSSTLKIPDFSGETHEEETHDKLASALRNSLVRTDDDDEDAGDVLDLRECTCTEILTQVYPELIRHWKSAGNVEKTVHFLIEAGSASIAIDDNTQATAYLKEILSIIDAVKQDENPFASDHINNVEEYDYDYWIEGRAQSLLGQSLYNLGRIDEAMPYFNNALKLLGNPQPGTKAAIHFKIFGEGSRQWKHHMFPASHLGIASNEMADQFLEQARCLSHIFHEYQGKQLKQEALMVVLQQVNRAEEADTDLHELIIAYTCMMECCQLINWPKLGQKYEQKAQMRCLNSKRNMEGMVTMGHFYATSLSMRLAWGKIEEAIESGTTGDGILRTIHDNDIRAIMLPYLCQALMLANKIRGAVEVLESLEYVTNETDDVIGKAWYFACCMDFILEAGYQLESYTDCLTFSIRAKHDPAFQTDRLPLFYLSACLTLWFQRHSANEKKEMWQAVAERTRPAKMQSYMAVHAFIKLLEVKLLELLRAKSDGSSAKIRKLIPVIEADFIQLKEYCKSLRVLRPRMLHLQAYFMLLQGLQGKSKFLLQQCRSCSKDQNNTLEMQWVDHSKAAWFDPKVSQKQRSIWAGKMQGEEEQPVDWHAAKNIEGSAIKYTLPLPRSNKR